MEEQKIKDIIKEIPQYKITKIANEISIRITNVFTNLKAQQDNLFKKLEECQIKIVKFENESITHYYLNGVIYLSNEIYILDNKDFNINNVKIGKRINIDYAEEAKDFLWRFYI